METDSTLKNVNTEKDSISSTNNSPFKSWRELYLAKFSFNTPFQLALEDEQTLKVKEVLRIIPGRRLVVVGTWCEKSVVAKLFVHPKFAKQHFDKESKGIKILNNNKIPTPHLYFQGQSKDKKIYVLIFAKIENAKSLAEVWFTKKSCERLLPLLHAIILEIATQHVLGVLQQDLHLKNFLLTKKTLYTLDGGGIEKLPYLLPKKMSMQSLALFFSQLGISIRDQQEKLFDYYAKSRGWLLKQNDIPEFLSMIKRWDDHRWQQFEKKIFRESSDFVCLKNSFCYSMFDRQYTTPDFLSFLQNPELAFNHPTTKILKSGFSSTVIRFTLHEKEFVVKRYNLKNLWHRIRRLLRPTRAFTSWRLAQKLKLFDILTATPVAFIEKRYFAFRDKSYFVTEYVSGEHAGDFFNRYQDDPEKMFSMIKKITALLKNLSKMAIIHGDLKITNILINQFEQPVLIDLDGASEHSPSRLKKRWRKDIQRFLKNFHHQPFLYEKFKEELKF